MLPLGPPDRHGSPYKARSAFAAWPGLLADPDAPRSTRTSVDAFRERHGYWIDGLGGAAGGDAAPTRCASTASGRRCGPTRPTRGVR